MDTKDGCLVKGIFIPITILGIPIGKTKIPIHTYMGIPWKFPYPRPGLGSIVIVIDVLKQRNCN